MNEDREMTLEIIKMVNERNLLLDKLLKGFVLIIIVIIISMSCAVGCIAVSFNNADVAKTSEYFQSDYPTYPDMSQSIEQNLEGVGLK